ncbi:L-fucose isomerase [bacterium]|nr:L-fucose isomerase [bacterium]
MAGFENRYPGDLPKVGIRPIIDGRRNGIRESLEEPTLAMARAAAELIENNLRHPSGQKVECVVPEFCIGGATEAGRVDALLAKEGATVSLSVTPCWCYGSETMDMDPLRPKAIWGFNGTERPGAVYLAATLSAHTQKGLPCFGIYGQDVLESGDLTIPEDVKEKILRFVKGGLAVATMRGKSYLAMGGVSMGIAGSIVDCPLIEEYLGMRVVQIDMTEFVRRMNLGIYDRDEFRKALAWVKENCQEGEDRNPPDKQHTREQKDQDWEMSLKMALIARDLMVGNPALRDIGFGEEAEGHNAICGGFQGQRQWTDYYPNGDFLEAILNSSFDWNGIRQPYIVATENDSLNGLTMLLGNMLTGTAQIFADVRTYWSPDAVKRVTGHSVSGDAANGFLHLINSGPAALDGCAEMNDVDGKPTMKPFWEMTNPDVKACLKATTWHPGTLEYFRGGGWSTKFVTRAGMPCTIFRLNLVKGLGPALQIAEGITTGLPEDAHKKLDLRTDPTWPTTWFAPRLTGTFPYESVYSVMNNWGANHCVLSPGHIGDDLITLASMLRIPVYMHNVEATRVFRPSSWSSFGTTDLEAGDFRACQAYGALYK